MTLTAACRKFERLMQLEDKAQTKSLTQPERLERSRLRSEIAQILERDMEAIDRQKQETQDGRP